MHNRAKKSRAFANGQVFIISHKRVFLEINTTLITQQITKLSSHSPNIKLFRVRVGVTARVIQGEFKKT